MDPHGKACLGKRYSSYLGQRRLMVDSIPTTELMASVRRWIEECTDSIHEEKTFLQYLSDGTVLCKLIQSIQSGLIKRTNRIKSPFAWRENILFFLEACHKLGLRDSELFGPDDLCVDNRTLNQLKSHKSQETKLRKVCESLYYLALKAAELPDYSGPTLPASLKGRGYSSTQHIPSAVSQRTNTKPYTAIRKVQSVASLVPETSQTNQQSFAEAVSSFTNSSGNTSEKDLSPLEPNQFGVNGTLLNKSASLQHLSTLSPVPVSQSPAESFEYPSSEASTVVLNTRLSPVASPNSPAGDTVSPSSPSQAHAPEDVIFLNNPFSPVHLSNKPAHQHIDHTGIIKRVDSQDTLSTYYTSPERDATYHYSLTQKSEDSYPSHSLERSKYSQRLKAVDTELCFSPEHHLVNLPSMSAVEDPCHYEPIDIPTSVDPQCSVPHHSINVGGPDSPSSYQEAKAPTEWREQDVELSLLPGEDRLGLNLVEDADRVLRVKAIGPDTAASRAGLMCEDELVSVNATSLHHTPLSTALAILQETMSTGKLLLCVRRAANNIPKFKSLKPPDLLDMSRVTSDALPHSLNATTVHVIHSLDPPDVADSVEVLSSPDETEPVMPQRSKSPRPFSAPTKSRSAAVLANNKASTLPNKSSSVSKLVRDRLADEREKRTASIHNNAQILLKYAQSRHSTHSTGSLPRSSQSPTQLGKLFETTDKLRLKLAGGSLSPELPPHHSSSTLDEGSSASTLLNLRHISMNETRLASVIHMDNIWRQVESGDDSSSKPDHSSSTDEPDMSVSESFHTMAEHYSQTSVDDVFKADEQTDLDNSSNRLSTPTPHTTSTPFTTPAPLATSTPHATPTHPTSNTTLINSTPFTTSTPLTKSTPALGNLMPPSSTSEDARQRSSSFSNKDIDSLLTTLKSLNSHEENTDDLRVLEDMLKSNTFKKAKKVHDQIHQLLSKESIKAVHRRIVPGTQLLRQTLHHDPDHCQETEELSSLLRKPHMQALLFCHDKVSTVDLYIPDTHFHTAAQDPVDIILSGSVCHFDTAVQHSSNALPLSREVPSGRKEGAVIVFLERTNKPLGVTIYKQEESAYVGKLMRGCDAEASNVLKEGDELLEVNGMPVWDKTTDHIISIMSPGRMEEGDILVLTIIPLHDDNIDLDYETKHMRAHFNYNGRLDEEIPCKALGLAFQKGDILEISNQDDPLWWQARKVFDDGAESLPGLIPSRHLQQQREALVRSYPFNFSSPKAKKGLGSIFKKRKKKVYYQSTSTSGSVGVGDEVPTYEEVVRLNAGQSPFRPIILIGAPRVGKRALLRELVKSSPTHFSTVVAHTSRNPRPGEVEGKEYFFVTREEFESDMHRDRFLEHGELKGVYYGTSFTSIKRIMESSQVPVLDVHPQALKKLRYSGLQPYVIFIASPRLERLRFTRSMVSEKGKKFGSNSQLQSDSVYTEIELRHMLEESLLIENQYGHYFDWIIVNDDFQVASDMLKEVARRVEEESQWIPTLWKYDRY